MEGEEGLDHTTSTWSNLNLKSEVIHNWKI